MSAARLSPRGMRRWCRVHTWSSLVCTLFLLLVCLTGLPLVFHHELEPWLSDIDAPARLPADAPRAPIDRVLDTARAARPDDVVHLVFSEAGEPDVLYVGMGRTPEAPLDQDIGVYVDTRSAALLGQHRFGDGIMDVLFRLHVDLFAGLPGKLFLGAMALMFLIALGSGVVIYAPFVRGRPFAAIRRGSGRRSAWLDLHNVLGIVTVLWALVVGATGMINTWADLVLKLWQFDQLAAMTAPYRELPPLTSTAPFGQALAAARAAEPDREFAFAAFPGTAFAGAHHYAVFMRGSEPLTARLLKPVLVDAADATVTDARDMPWYVTALLISQPLHFGDYGGLPFKIVWAVLDVIVIVILLSGLYLWWVRRKLPLELRLREEAAQWAEAGP